MAILIQPLSEACLSVRLAFQWGLLSFWHLGKSVKVREKVKGKSCLPNALDTPPPLTVLMTSCLPLNGPLENQGLIQISSQECSSLENRTKFYSFLKFFFNKWGLKTNCHKKFAPHCKRVQGILQLVYIPFNFFLLFWYTTATVLPVPSPIKYKILQFEKKSVLSSLF